MVAAPKRKIMEGFKRLFKAETVVIQKVRSRQNMGNVSFEAPRQERLQTRVQNLTYMTVDSWKWIQVTVLD